LASYTNGFDFGEEFHTVGIPVQTVHNRLAMGRTWLRLPAGFLKMFFFPRRLLALTAEQ
jgi:hypothetical protein